MKIIKSPLYFALLHPVVLNDKSVSLAERSILSITIQLTKLYGYCFANNQYFADNLNCSTSLVSKSFKNLQKLGYVTSSYPNPEKGGRGYCRTVRADLLLKPKTDSKPPDNDSDNMSLRNPTTLHRKKTKHTSIVNNNTNNNDISAEQEKQMVTEKLKIIFRNKLQYHDSIKKIYNQNFPIHWDKNSVSDLICLCNNLDETYSEFLLKIKAENRFSSALELFELLLSSKPKYFTDSQPATFVRFYNRVITQKDYLGKLKRILYPNDRDGYFGREHFSTD